MADAEPPLGLGGPTSDASLLPHYAHLPPSFSSLESSASDSDDLDGGSRPQPPFPASSAPPQPAVGLYARTILPPTGAAVAAAVALLPPAAGGGTPAAPRQLLLARNDTLQLLSLPPEAAAAVAAAAPTLAVMAASGQMCGCGDLSCLALRWWASRP